MSQGPKINPLKSAVGRGTSSNQDGRFNQYRMEVDFSDYGWLDEDEKVLLRTEFFRDNSKSIITENDSPDIGFRYSVNAYRGCEHGCAYCYARPTHEYLGLSSGLDFETKIFVKEKAPELLREKLMSRSWQPEIVMMSGITDCYQPAERKFELTRQCLKIFAEFKNPIGIITKNHLVTRDIDILSEMAKDQLAVVYLSVTTLNAETGRYLEPRTSAPLARLKAIEALAKAGVPVGVNVAPLIPGLTDHELPQILKAASEAGAREAGYTPLRLPYSVADHFAEWLGQHKPEAKQKVLQYIRGMRDGKINDSEFGSRMRGSGPMAHNMKNMFDLFSRKYGFGRRDFSLRTDLFQRPGDQLSLL